jgi:hypothetical protein
MEVVVVRTFHDGKRARRHPARISGSVAVDVRLTPCVDAPRGEFDKRRTLVLTRLAPE